MYNPYVRETRRHRGRPSLFRTWQLWSQMTVIVFALAPDQRVVFNILQSLYLNYNMRTNYNMIIVRMIY